MKYHSPLLNQLQQALQTYTGDDFVDASEVIAINRIRHPMRAHDIKHGMISPHAGVLVLLTNEPSPRLLLTRRSSHLNSHAGEVSLVGGKVDQDDKDIVFTALREATEEVALPANQVHLMGLLPMQLSKANLLVRPVVAVITPSVAETLCASEDEIARLFWVELEYFLNTLPTSYRFDIDDKGKTHPKNHLTTPSAYLHTPAWLYDGEIIWGMTGRILANLLLIGFDKHLDWEYRLLTPHSPITP